VRLTRRIAGWWFAPAPAERLAALRIAIGGFAVIWVTARLPELVAVARLPASELAPIGVVRVLRAPLPPGAVVAIAVAAVACLVAFTAGWRYRVTAPLAALGLLWTLSYRHAWGMVFHTDNLLVLHVIALACAPAADAWAVGRGADRPAPAAGHGWAIKLLAALTCATYLLAGIAKLRLSGPAWIDGAQLRNQIAIDGLRKALLGATVAPLARLFVAHPGGLVGFAALTLGIELGAPLALLGGRIARLWVCAAWAFHLGVVLTMNVWFPYPLAGLAFLPLLDAERLVARPVRWWRSRGMRGPGSAVASRT
jgi:vitamin K-dependent gamma-carboxylase-like protein